MRRVLVLSAHTDDAEWGIGGTIAKLVSQGDEVHSLAISSCPEVTSELLEEHRVAMVALGVSKENITVALGFKNREFASSRQRILEDIEAAMNLIAPHIIFTPSPEDSHQDHEVVGREAVRACRRSNIDLYAYSSPSHLNMVPNCYSALHESHMENKLRALEAYKSQVKRLYMSKVIITSHAIFHGHVIGETYAEPLVLLRGVMM